jgi:sterol-4alpha-carboxylate 3-dehydrogenase (decarboxylating)
MAVLHAGQGFLQLGSNKNKQDFDHVENATYGHCLACEKLLDPADPSLPGPAAGEAFNITSGNPIEFFTFFRKLYHEYNGYQPYFTLVIPVWIAYIIAVINEMVMRLFNRKPQGLTRFTLVYATAWRAHSIQKAQKLLGYEPVVSLDEGIKRAVKVSLTAANLVQANLMSLAGIQGG